MGVDGRCGSLKIRDAGGTVIARDKETSVVWGMPGAVARDGLADRVLPLLDVAPAIVGIVGLGERRRAAAGAS